MEINKNHKSLFPKEELDSLPLMYWTEKIQSTKSEAQRRTVQQLPPLAFYNTRSIEWWVSTISLWYWNLNYSTT